jgi:methylase of polypeptide subunit release factors
MLNDLKNHWHSKIKNDESNLYVWNNMAERFGNFPVPKWDKDGFLKVLDATVDFNHEMTVLDIGCGAGTFSIALSERAAQVTAVDISPQMLEYAKGNADKHKRDNIDFVCADWKDIDLFHRGWNRSFDLVIAHNTPAISDAQTFEKMMESSRDYCFFAKPTRRTDSVSGKLPEILGIPTESNGKDEDIIIALSILWYQGLLPEMIQLNDHWAMGKPLEEACEFYINKLKAYNEIDGIQEKAVENYLSSIAVNNTVYEKTNTAVTIIAWRNNGKFLKSGQHERS